MAKTISNKKYEEFWNKDELDIKKDELTDKKEPSNKEDISKEIKKEVKKEVKKLESKVKELTDKVILPVSSIENTINITEEPKKEINIDEDKVIIVEPDYIKENKSKPEKEIKKTKKEESIKPNIIKNEQIDNSSNKIEKKPKTIKNNDITKKEVKKEEPKKLIQITERKPKNIYESYIMGEEQYRIYFRGNLIYDSANHEEKPIFKENEFILFGKNYIYRGIRFEKY